MAPFLPRMLGPKNVDVRVEVLVGAPGPSELPLRIDFNQHVVEHRAFFAGRLQHHLELGTFDSAANFFPQLRSDRLPGQIQVIAVGQLHQVVVRVEVHVVKNLPAVPGELGDDAAESAHGERRHAGPTRHLFILVDAHYQQVAVGQ